MKLGLAKHGCSRVVIVAVDGTVHILMWFTIVLPSIFMNNVYMCWGLLPREAFG